MKKWKYPKSYFKWKQSVSLWMDIYICVLGKDKNTINQWVGYIEGEKGE